MKILVLNGVNMNMLGIREKGIYGHETFEDLEKKVIEKGKLLGIEVISYQSNYEGELVEKIQQAYETMDGIVINPGAYTHTSIALLDALKAVQLPAVEVHISNIDEREDFRKISYIGMYCEKRIYGKGIAGYEEAIEYLYNKLANCGFVHKQ
ncbi:type II 3-dehydroquinate dehydratase [Peptoanaerobacter stomatis]